VKSPYYVNLWGEIGPETQKYASVAALLTTLDELGIWQTTVSYTFSSRLDENVYKPYSKNPWKPKKGGRKNEL